MDDFNTLLNALTAFIVAVTALWAKMGSTFAKKANKQVTEVHQKMDAVKAELENGGSVKNQIKQAVHELEEENKQ